MSIFPYVPFLYSVAVKLHEYFKTFLYLVLAYLQKNLNSSSDTAVNPELLLDLCSQTLLVPFCELQSKITDLVLGGFMDSRRDSETIHYIKPKHY